jgi:hypothetical protein
MALAGFEPTFPESERPPTHALDRAATGIGNYYLYNRNELNQRRQKVKIQLQMVIPLKW